MRVAVIGATGLIGSAGAAPLSSRGYSVVSMSRSVPGGSLNAFAVDISEANSSSYWLPRLHGVDAIINCAGVRRHSPKGWSAMVHHLGVASLFDACEQLGIRRVIQCSAIGVDRET